MLGSMDSTPVTFIERSGEDSLATLRTVRRRLEAAGFPCRLLRGRGRDELHLLVVDGAPELAQDETRAANVWRFEDVATADPVATSDT